MPLRIFVSSVSGEFADERAQLEVAIRHLGDVFVGMEYFGSDPRPASTFDDDALRASDLYVGLFGDRFGSTEPVSGKSFTQLEYDTARRLNLPTLAYFKGTILSGAEEPGQADFKRQVAREQLASIFHDPRELEKRFLIDLFNQVRGPLFTKVRPQLGLIGFDTLLSLTQAALPEQIAAVGHDKYVPELYVARPAEQSVLDFAEFELHYATRFEDVLRILAVIAVERGLSPRVDAPLRELQAAARVNQAAAPLARALGAVKDAFYFTLVEGAAARLDAILQQTEEHNAPAVIAEFWRDIRHEPYVAERLGAEFQRVAFDLARTHRVNRGAFRSIHAKEIFPSTVIEGTTVLANDLLKELERLNELAARPCLAIVERAGLGKTNTVCRVAEVLSAQHPVVLLSGQLDFSHDRDIEWHIRRRIEFALGTDVPDWIERSALGLVAAQRWLFVIIDGINEVEHLPLFGKLLQRLLPRLRGSRVKLVVSCRDIFWDLFQPTMRPYLFEQPVPLNEFSLAEWEQAVALYFDRFRLTARLEGNAAAALRNPLLLRFFCHAYEGRTLGVVRDIHLLSVFDLYLDNAGRNIASRLGLLGTDSVQRLLVAAARAMWQERAPVIDQDRLSVSATEIDSINSLYTLVRAENVILAEARGAHTRSKTVRFVYDVFMEYMLARAWFEVASGTENRPETQQSLIEEALDSLVAFPSALGALLFLDQMLELDGRLVSRAMQAAHDIYDVLLESRQTTLLLTLEHINANEVSDELLALIDEFETVAHDELRPRLAETILRLFPANSHRPALRRVVERVLELRDGRERRGGMSPDAGPETAIALRPLAPAPIEPPGASIVGRMLGRLTEWRQRLRPDGPSRGAAPAPDVDARVPGPLNRDLGIDAFRKYEAERQRAARGEDPTAFPRLPQARYHYSEEAKLNAIALLIAARDVRDYEVIDRAIRGLGRMDLHSALHALQSLEFADDEVVFRAVERALSDTLDEYRLYSAWLLRDRYGSRPARYVRTLLSDPSTRVRRYVYRLFETRGIEEALASGLLADLDGTAPLPSWLTVSRVKLLGRRANLRPADLAQMLAPSIVGTLYRLTGHGTVAVRVSAYRSLLNYADYVDATAVRLAMDRDTSRRLHGGVPPEPSSATPGG